MAMAKPWNPMEDAYKSKDFNKYQQGPGAELSDELQPGALAATKLKENSESKNFKLCLKCVPNEMTEKSINNLCSNFGKVNYVNFSSKTPFVFVTFATLNDMERAYSGLKGNIHGIVVDFAKQRYNNSSNNSIVGTTNEILSEKQSSNVDMSRRNIKGPFTNPPRPQPVPQSPLVTQNDYKNSNLLANDPRQHFLISQDIHGQDRNGYGNRKHSNDKNKKMHTGRACYVESKEITDNIKNLAAASTGNYNSDKTINSNSIIVSNCLLCTKPANKICQRCGDFYCSIECQKKDWQRHRYICFQMPELVSVHTLPCGAKNLPKTIPNLENQNQTANLKNANQNVEIPKQIQNSSKTRTASQVSLRNSHKSKNLMQNNQSQSNDSKKSNRKSNEANKTNGNTKEESKNSEEKIIPMAEFPQSGNIVAITAISKSNLIYIRSMLSEDNVDYVKTINTINNEAKSSKCIDKLPSRGDVLISDFQGTGFYRVLVLNLDGPTKITVAFIDFGNIDIKTLSDLKELPEKILSLKRHALPVCLKDVTDFQPNEKVLDYLNSYVNTAKDVKIVYDKLIENVNVELYDISTNECINRKIMEMCKIKVPKLNDEPIFTNDIDMKLLESGENVPVYIFDNSMLEMGYISCIHEKDVATIHQFNLQLKQYAETVHEPYTPRESELCLVKYEEDGMWYRAECIEVVGDENPSVLFIDFGNMITSHIRNIRKYPRDLIHPCMTAQCLIADLIESENLDAKLIQRLKELLPMNQKIVIDKIEAVAESETNVIYLKNIISTLKNEKLI